MTTHGTNLKPKGITKAGLEVANIPPDYWEVDFSTYKGPKDAAKASWEYLEMLRVNKPNGVGLMLGGPVGVGKTTLMALVLKYLVKARWTVYMTSLSELVEVIKRSWDTKDTQVIDHCKEVEYLGLDDLGREHAGPTGFSAVTFDNVLRYRVQYRLPTFFTTNLNRKEIGARYSNATLSLIEGKSKVIKMNGSDYRMMIQKHEL